MTRTIAYDPTGRATSGYVRKYPLASDAFALAYDGAGNIQSAITPSGEYFYGYDHRNLRVSKTGPGAQGGLSRFSYDTTGRLLIDSGVSSTQEYLYLAGQPVALLVDDDNDPQTPAKIYVLGTSHQGAPMRAYERSTGQGVWAADYEPFGHVSEYRPDSALPPSISIPMRYPGQY